MLAHRFLFVACLGASSLVAQQANPFMINPAPVFSVPANGGCNAINCGGDATIKFEVLGTANDTSNFNMAIPYGMRLIDHDRDNELATLDFTIPANTVLWVQGEQIKILVTIKMYCLATCINGANENPMMVEIKNISRPNSQSFPITNFRGGSDSAGAPTDCNNVDKCTRLNVSFKNPVTGRDKATRMGDPRNCCLQLSSGSGCSGTTGEPKVSFNSLPRIGNSTFALRLSNAQPSSPFWMLIGDPTIPARFFNCPVWVLPAFTLPGVSDPLGNADVPVPIPNQASLVGAAFMIQGAVVTDKGAPNPLGLAMSGPLPGVIQR